ncbi:DUF3866 family protein [Pseudokineococcus sp. 1T1Z-3]|uniref:DUF3866 family protein n=1 Tax=Pseudokineococcus sp. 1T1Z-3 TaxID=3132745 RepID=UPI00309D13E3
MTEGDAPGADGDGVATTDGTGVPHPQAEVETSDRRGTVHWRRGVVTDVVREWPGVREVAARLDASLPGTAATTGAGERGGDAEEVRATALTDLVGAPEVGDEVLLSVSALARGLGTGGSAGVVAVPGRLPPDPPPSPGHLVKARYTPLQAMVLGVDEQESPHHGVMAEADDLAGLPVVVADLHSALPAVLAGWREARARVGLPPGRCVYVMTDGGALPAALSRAAAGLRRAGWLDAVVTTGQAFGGDHEAVTLHTGLLAARHVLDADLVVVAQGPGNLGSGTRWGFSGVACGEAVNATSVLGGRAVASLRVSGADGRERHLGVSHHSLTAYGRVALAPAEVVVPVLGGALGERVREQAATLAGRHRLVEVGVDGLDEALAVSPVRLSTMGRGVDVDPAPFLAAAAAGRWAACDAAATS